MQTIAAPRNLISPPDRDGENSDLHGKSTGVKLQSIPEVQRVRLNIAEELARKAPSRRSPEQRVAAVAIIIEGKPCRREARWGVSIEISMTQSAAGLGAR
jgi:hypothetical protein